jgi:hypothetical protein
MKNTLLIAVTTLMFLQDSYGQVDFPRLQVGVAYAALGSTTGLRSTNGRYHNGIIVPADINLRPWFGLENYAGLYGIAPFGNKRVKMVCDTFGLKFTARGTRAMLYGTAGVGVSYLTHDMSYGSVFPTLRYAPGVEFKVNDFMSFRSDFGFMTFKMQRFAGWETAPNFTGGVLFSLRQ